MALLQTGQTVVLFAVFLLVLALAALRSAVVVVGAAERRALWVLGEFRGVLEPGINVVPPFVSDTTAIDLRTRTVDVPRQTALTRDGEPVAVDLTVDAAVGDVETVAREVDDHWRAVSNGAQAAARTVVGELDRDDALAAQEQIGLRVRDDLDDRSDEWGVRVESVDVQAVERAAGGGDDGDSARPADDTHDGDAPGTTGGIEPRSYTEVLDDGDG